MLRCVPLIALLLLLSGVVRAENGFRSPATGGVLKSTLILPDKHDGPLPTVVYLTNLSIPGLGRDTNDTILADLHAQGLLVLVLDYEKHPNAVSPKLNADVLAIREAVTRKALLGDQKVDLNHLYILAEGFGLKRDIEFARDGDRVLALDLFYPANPAKPVAVISEFSCDNANRMGPASMVFCQDSLVEGAQFAGFAAAMIDHPVRPPYKGIDDPMPQSRDRAKAAIAKLREQGFNKVGVIGFSRGASFAAMLAADHTADAALVHGNRFDYLSLESDDPMLARFTKAWGDPKTNADRWASHSAIPLLTKNSSPMFLNTSDAESREYRHGLQQLDQSLTKLGVEHVYQFDNDGRGHRMTQDPKTLEAIYSFFHKHLD